MADFPLVRMRTTHGSLQYGEIPRFEPKILRSWNDFEAVGEIIPIPWRVKLILKN